MAYNKQEKDIVEKVLKVLLRDESERGVNELRIVSWIIDGKTTAPRLERRDKYVDKRTGEEKIGKCKGMTAADLQFIFAKKDEIIAIMLGQSRPRSPAPGAAPHAAAPVANQPAAPSQPAPVSAPADDDF